MAPSTICFIFLHLVLLSNAQFSLTVHPVNPMVALGESIQLNCSIDCPLGRTSWKGLDTNLNGQYIAPGYSVQTIENASITVEGTRICVGSCPGMRRNLQASIYLYVYALPQSLLLNYSMRNGIPYLHCSMNKAYPPEIIPPEIRCYRWSKKLDDPIEEKVGDDGEYLTTVTWSWEVRDEDWISDTQYNCQAKIVFGDHMLIREGTLKISNKAESSPTFAASSTIHTGVTLSRRFKTTYVKTTVAASTVPQTMSGVQESVALRNGQSTFLDKDLTNTVTQSNNTNTLRTTMSDLRTQKKDLSTKIPSTDYTHLPITSQGVTETDTSSLPVIRTINKVETSTTSAASSTTHTGVTLSRRVKTTLAASTDPHTVSGVQESAALRNGQSTFLNKDLTNTVTHSNNTNTLKTTMSDFGTQRTDLSTRIPSTDFTHQPITSQGATETDTSSLPVIRTINKDGLSLVSIIAPAAGLAGSILLSLQMWKHLKRKGFFQPTQIDWSGVKEGTKLQDHSLQVVYSPNASTKMEYTVY